MLEICRHCGTNIFPNKDRTCPHCHGHLDGAPAIVRIPNGVVCRTCPNCGTTAHRRVKPDRWIAFVWDHVCDNCRTRYVPPTPIWAAILFIAIGLLIMGVTGFEVLLHLAQGQPELAVWKLIFVLLGLPVVIYGIRSLRQRCYVYDSASLANPAYERGH